MGKPTKPLKKDDSSSGDGGIRPTAKTKRTRKCAPRESPAQRSSIYRGVTRHRWTGRYEAHLWDKNSWNESQSKKGRQVYLGAYEDEAAAAHAYDLAALKYWGQSTVLNFPASTYQEELKEMEGQSKEEYIGSLRRKSSGFSRGVSKYRGVARHHHNGRWEARIGRVFGNKYLYLGTFATQEEAAEAYDLAAIEYRGLNAITNFDLSRYLKCLRPSDEQAAGVNPDQNPSPGSDLGVGFLEYGRRNGNGNGNGNENENEASGYGEGERTPAEDSPGAGNPLRCSFPDDIQTYFDCELIGEGDDFLFGGDLSCSFSDLFSDWDGE